MNAIDDTTANWPDPDLIPDTPDDPFWTRPGCGGDGVPWPEWIGEFRGAQVDACREIVDGYRRGNGLMLLDAPTGAGKTIIGEMVRRARQATDGGGVPTATYVCHTIGLQNQLVKDFPYARSIKGAANYPTLDGPEWVTCADCDGDTCGYCPDVGLCPYKVARAEAFGGALAVANTSYWLHQANHAREGLRGRGLLIVDECDTLESALMGFVEFSVSRDQLERAGVDPLAKGVRVGKIVEWLDLLASGARGWANRNMGKARGDVKVARQVRAMRRVASAAVEFRKEYDAVDWSTDGDDGVQWVRDYQSYAAGKGGVTWKAVKVSAFGGEDVWQHCQDALAMSATVVSAEEWADSCGVDAAGIQWGEVQVPSTFAKENRPVIVVPAANMTAKTLDVELPKLLTAIDRVLTLDRDAVDARVLIHTTSYRINTAVVEHLRRGHKGRDVITHAQGGGVGDRDYALRRYLDTPSSILVSPAMDRGVDLPGEACRVQVICKVPFPNLGDRQISTRLRTVGGQTWYTVSTARTIVQMTGRGVRSDTDHATTYILDKQFNRWWKDAKRVLPDWWMEGVQPGRLTDFQ